jgi:hypothetical protein
MNVAVQLTNTELEFRTLTIPQQAKALEIRTSEDAQRASEIYGQIKAMRKEIDAFFDPNIQKAHELHKQTLAQKKKMDAPLVEAEQVLKPKLLAYNREQERKVAEEAARLRREAYKREEEIRIARAAQAEEEGFKQEAEKILNEPTPLPPPVIPAPIQKVEGFKERTLWKFEVMDSSLVPEEYKKVDEVAIGKVVRALGKMCKISGVRVYEEIVGY